LQEEAKGHSDREMNQHLHLSIDNVKSHLELNARSHTRAATSQKSFTPTKAAAKCIFKHFKP
jgi:hypothetical protein